MNVPNRSAILVRPLLGLLWLGVALTILGCGRGTVTRTTPTFVETKTATPAPTDPTTTDPTSAWESFDYSAYEPLDYAVIAEDPTAHVGESVFFYCEVVQALGAAGQTVFLCDHDRYGILSPMMIAVLDPKAGDLFVGDVIVVYGAVLGRHEYADDQGASISIPEIRMDRYEVVAG